MGIQASPEVAWKGSGIPACDSNCLMSLPKMEDFIRLATKHAARCGEELVLIDRDMTCGAYVKENGDSHSVACCQIAIDGAGATRAYQHRITGKQAALVANDMATGLPVALHVSTVSLLL